MLDKELEEGIYVNVIFDKLTELEANDKENCLIKMVKRDSEAAANINDGRCTKRFAALSVEGREREIQSASAAASGVFNSLDKELLINDKNWKDRFTSGRGLKTGKCSKCGREIGLRGDKCG
jgi:hypothetical protein